MTFPIPPALIVFLLVLLVLGVLIGILSPTHRRTLPYQKKPSFLTPAEKSFYELLLAAFGSRYCIFAQVNLDKLIIVRGAGEDYLSAYRRMNQYSVDFLLCAKPNLTPLAAIELDDRSHALDRRARRDELVNAILKSAGVPLLRFQVQTHYNLNDIQTRIETALQPPTPANQSTPGTASTPTTS